MGVKTQAEVFVKILGNTSEVHENTRKSAEVHGNTLKYMEVQRSTWKYGRHL